MKNRLLIFLMLIVFRIISLSAQIVFIEAESFDNKGGWVIDQQSMDQMGSPYVLAHGMGVPVENATTQIEIPKSGEYRLWARTRNWVAPWTDKDGPGKFKILINDNPSAMIFGTKGAEWHWQDGGNVQLKKGAVEIALNDLTGFNGRCDAIIFSKD